MQRLLSKCEAQSSNPRTVKKTKPNKTKNKTFYILEMLSRKKFSAQVKCAVRSGSS
jgi:hypothetical protein